MHRPFLTGFVTFMLSANVFAADKRPMEIPDLLKVRHASGLSVSPDGRKIAYGLTQMRNVLAGEDNGSSKRHLFVASAPQNTRPYVAGDVSVSAVRFAPDGSRVSFRAKMKGDSHTKIYQIPVDGGGAQALYEHSASINSYAWAPDGKTLYFTANPVANALKKKQNKQGFNARVYEGDKRPDTLWRLDMTKQPLAAQQIKVDGHPSQIKVSPNGRYLLVPIAPTPHVDDELMKRRVHVLSAKSGKVRHIIETPGKIGPFVVAPNSKDFAIIAGVDQNDPAATTLYRGTVGKDALTPIRSGAFAVVDIEWLDDGRIAALIHEGEGSRLEMLASDGSVLQSVPQVGNVVHDIAADNNRVFASVSAPNAPREVFALGEDGLRQWTRHNSWTDTIAFAKSESYSYAARDGQSVSGILTMPLKRKGKKRVPLMLIVHGGPEAHDSNGWTTSYGDPVQIAAGAGYATFMPNYRGSTGRGTAFSKQHQNDYAGKEFNDLVDAVKALVNDGLVDEKRVGITGGSYGGYASAWAATALTEHFAASVMFVGISNQISKFGTTDIPNEMYLVHSRVWPWEDWDKMLKASPITYAGQSKTATLILHGEEDTRVHPSQSYEMYRNLKLRSQAPVRFVTYPGEGHGNRKAAARIDYALRLMRWMDHFVKDQKDGMPGMDMTMLPDLMAPDEDAKK